MLRPATGSIGWRRRRAQPYLRLMRFDRPIGAWLLLFPCWWGQALAELSLGRAYPSPFLVGLFLAGAFIMRGAGCTYNDIVDRDYDASVARTAARPIPSGQVSVAQAWVFLILLCLAGLAILVQLNAFTIVLGASSLLLIAVYPFAKRFTYWPQLVLGLTFKWGALVGWAAVTGSLSLAPVVLYAGCVLWTIGYDTIYAHQDKDDDAGGRAQVDGAQVRRRHAALACRILCRRRLAVGGWRAFSPARAIVFLIALGLAALQLGWQVATLDIADTRNCLARFRSNQLVGWALFLGLAADMGLAALVSAH